MKNNILKVLVILLLVIVFILGGYLVYDKILSNDNNSITGSSTNNNETDNSYNKIVIKGYLGDLISDVDKSMIDEAVNFKNINIKIADLVLTFNCTGFGGAPGDYCWSREILLNGTKVSDSQGVVGDINMNPYLIVTDNYFIIQQPDYDEINIFDKKGNKLKDVDEVVHTYQKDGEENYSKNPMYIENDRLYFYGSSSINEDPYSKKTISLNYVDLLDPEFKVVKTGKSVLGIVACKEC